MLAAVRSAMEREFADFFETGTGGKSERLWRQASPRLWDTGSASACDGSRLDGPLPSSAKARSLLRDLPTCFEGQPRGELSRRLAPLPMKPVSRPVIASSFLNVAQTRQRPLIPASLIDIGRGLQTDPIQARRRDWSAGALTRAPICDAQDPGSSYLAFGSWFSCLRSCAAAFKAAFLALRSRPSCARASLAARSATSLALCSSLARRRACSALRSASSLASRLRSSCSRIS